MTKLRCSSVTLVVPSKFWPPQPPCRHSAVQPRSQLDDFERRSYGSAKQSRPAQTCLRLVFCCGSSMHVLSRSLTLTTISSATSSCAANAPQSPIRQIPLVKVSLQTSSLSCKSAGQRTRTNAQLLNKRTAACCYWIPPPAPCKVHSSCGSQRARVPPLLYFTASWMPCRLSQGSPTRNLHP